MKHMKTKEVITYRVVEEHSNTGRTCIYIESRSRVLIEDAKRNGDPDNCLHLMGPSDTYYYRGGDFERSVALEYLHFGDSEYCSHRTLEFCGGLRGMTFAHKTLTKISRRIAKSRGRYDGPREFYGYELNCPQGVINELDNMGAVQVDYSLGSPWVVKCVKGDSVFKLVRIRQAA